MISNLKIFLFLMVFVVLSFLTALRHIDVDRFVSLDTSTSEPIEPLIILAGEKGTIKLTKVKKKDTDKMTTNERPVKSTFASMDKNNSTTVAYKEISLVNARDWYLGWFQLEKIFLNCEVKTCRLRKGWKYFNTSDAVVFFDVNSPLRKGWKYVNTSDAVVFFDVNSPLRTPPKRPNPDQIWVVSGWETPHHSRSKVFSNQGWTYQINWTMTYRLDSDIPVPYGFVEKNENKSNKDYGTILTNKQKMVAWVVSNCHTPGQRMKYVKQLKEIVPVDVFGRCGSPAPKDLFGMINKTYKFYLSFENSLCKDYITEKFLMRQNLDVVLITRGGGNYTKFYPQESFINSNKFKNAHELGKFLLKLDKDNIAYLNYLKSKENYRSLDFGVSIRKGLCNMCKMLHDKEIHRNVYKDYHKWWWNSDCNSKPTDIIL